VRIDTEFDLRRPQYFGPAYTVPQPDPLHVGKELGALCRQNLTANSRSTERVGGSGRPFAARTGVPRRLWWQLSYQWSRCKCWIKFPRKCWRRIPYLAGLAISRACDRGGSVGLLPVSWTAG